MLGGMLAAAGGGSSSSSAQRELDVATLRAEAMRWQMLHASAAQRHAVVEAENTRLQRQFEALERRTATWQAEHAADMDKTRARAVASAQEASAAREAERDATHRAEEADAEAASVTVRAEVQARSRAQGGIDAALARAAGAEAALAALRSGAARTLAEREATLEARAARAEAELATERGSLAVRESGARQLQEQRVKQVVADAKQEMEDARGLWRAESEATTHAVRGAAEGAVAALTQELEAMRRAFSAQEVRAAAAADAAARSYRELEQQAHAATASAQQREATLVARRHTDEAEAEVSSERLKRERAEGARLQGRIDALNREMDTRETASRSLASALDSDAVAVAKAQRESDQMAKRVQAAEGEVLSLRAALEAAAAECARLRGALGAAGMTSPPTASVTAPAAGELVAEVAALRAEKGALATTVTQQVTPHRAD